jgi:hypothetical protein
MMIPSQRWRKALIGLAAVCGLAAGGALVRRGSATGCALDGMPIDPLLRIHVVDARGRGHDFCCISCAELWLGRQTEPAHGIYVTDEASGQQVDARHAYFVRSLVITVAATENRIHAFARRADARKHADAFGGRILSQSVQPFCEHLTTDSEQARAEP